MWKMDYLNKFIEDNRPVLKFVYVIDVSDEEWFISVAYGDNKTGLLDRSAIKGYGQVDFTFNPNTGLILEEIAAMKECGFLEED